MRLTYDPEADAAYLTVRDEPVGDGEAVTTLPAIVSPNGSEVALDFDGDGRLLGIEVLHASATLPREVLARAFPVEDA